MLLRTFRTPDSEKTMKTTAPAAPPLPAAFRAMAFCGTKPLRMRDFPLRPPGPRQLLIRVNACGVCRTDLHTVDAELAVPRLPVVPGHEAVGTVLAIGEGAEGFAVGDRVGAAWLHDTCLRCRWCAGGRENLCPDARFTGLHVNGGYATHMLADARFCLHIPDRYDDVAATPLLCAGLIGYRALRAAGDVRRVGIYGFGAAGHLVAQTALHQGREVYAFTRRGDDAAQALALRLGATWAGDSTQPAPVPLDAAILFAPIGALVPKALQDVEPGGTVVCGGIHMSDIPSFPYRILWQERAVRSIANLTRADGAGFMELAAQVPLRVETEVFALGDANLALDRLRDGRITGAAVLDCR
jgi:alcohol dehydrogenase, propanol-preferring